MNKKLAIGLGIAGIVAAGIGSVAYIAKSNLEKREQDLIAQVNAFKGSLPSTYNLEKVQSNSNFFESKGRYVFSSNDPTQKSSNAQILLDYRASHGINSWFGGKIQFVADGKLEGEIVKTYQIKTDKSPGMFFKVEGFISEDNSIVSKNILNDFSFIVPLPVEADLTANQNATEVTKNIKADPTGMLVNIKGNTSSFLFNLQTGNLKSDIQYQSILAEDLESPTDKIVASNLSLNYESNVKSLDIGTLKLQVDNINDGTDAMKVDGFEFLAVTEQKAQKYNMKLNTKVKSLTVMGQSGAFELGYSINGIDKAMIALSQKIGTTLASRAELTEEETKQAQTVLLSNLKTGFSFKIDRIKVVNEKNQIDFSGHYEVVPTPKDKEFSFQSQSSFGAEFKVIGDMVPMAYSVFSSILGVELSEDEKEFKFKVGFETGSLKINDKQADPAINEGISNILKTMDGHFGIGLTQTTSEIKPVEDQPAADIFPSETKI